MLAVKNDGFIGFFEEFVNQNKTARQLILDMNISIVEDDMVESCIQKVPINADSDYVRQFILNRQKRMQLIIDKKVEFRYEL